VVLVEQAGGVVTAYNGSELELAGGRLIACAPGIHSAIVAGLAECTPVPGHCFGAPELDQQAA
jgi:myo-inositol-1(or 4)-monophosphatase